MPPVNPGLNSFVAGEISPLLAGRTDLDWYKNACRRMRNMVSLVEGGATRRPASRFVGRAAAGSTITILKSFIFSQQQARMLAFSDGVLRYYADKAPIVTDTAPGGIITPTPYQAADLRGLKFEQSADVLFIFHPKYQPRQLQRHSDTDWRMTPLQFTDGPYLEVNANDNLTMSPSATTGQITISASNSNTTLHLGDWNGAVYPTPTIGLDVRGITFTGDTLNLPAGTAAIATAKAVTLTGSVPAPINEAEGTTYYWISTGALTGKLATSAANANAGTFINLAAIPVVHTFHAGDVGRLVRLGSIATNWQKAHVYSVGDIVKNGSQGVYICTVGGTSQDVANAGPAGTGVGIGDGTATWDFVNAGGVQWGYAKITAVNGYNTVTANVITPLAATGATKYWRLGVWSQTTGYPSCGLLHQQRMLYSGTTSYPDRIDTSAIADYFNMAPGDTDDTAISETLGLPTVDPIYWMASKRSAYLGTQGATQKAFGADGYDSPLTPNSFVVIEQARRGSANIAPVRVGNGLAFVHRLRRKLYELYYDFTQDLDTSTEISARARHLIASGIVDHAYQEEPYSIIWLCTGDGHLVGCTYYRDQQVLGWHLHSLGGAGAVESVETLPGDTSDQVWLVVRRTIDGEVRRHIEVLDDFNGLGTATAPEDLAFLDSYAVYEGPPATHIAGLGYLEGETVQVLGDGAMLESENDAGFVVQGGRINLPYAVSKAYVGLDYSATSELRPMPLAVAQPDGSPLGDKSKVSRVKVGLYRSGAFRIGPDASRLDTTPMRKPEMAMGAPAPLFTGPFVTDPLDSEFELEANVEIRPIGPLPLTVLWAVPHLVTQAGS